MHISLYGVSLNIQVLTYVRQGRLIHLPSPIPCFLARYLWSPFFHYMFSNFSVAQQDLSIKR